jgi:hypothetical protein
LQARLEEGARYRRLARAITHRQTVELLLKLAAEADAKIAEILRDLKQQPAR